MLIQAAILQCPEKRPQAPALCPREALSGKAAAKDSFIVNERVRKATKERHFIMVKCLN